MTIIGSFSGVGFGRGVAGAASAILFLPPLALDRQDLSAFSSYYTSAGNQIAIIRVFKRGRLARIAEQSEQETLHRLVATDRPAGGVSSTPGLVSCP